MKSIQIVFMIFLFINGYLFYESNNDEEERSKYRRQSNSDDEAKILKYKPKDKTTTKSLKRKHQPYNQNSSDEEKEVLEYKPEGFRSEPRFLNPSSTTTTKSSYNQSTTTRDIMLLIKPRLRSHLLRREEFFNTYLNSSQIKNNTGDHLIYKFTRDDITRLIGRGNHLLVYDCQNPSIIIRNRKKRMFLSLIVELASSSNCTNLGSIGKNALWLRGGQSYKPVTYDLKTRKFSKPPLPMYDLITYFDQLGLCEEFLMFMGHPYYYIKNSIKPDQCDRIVNQI